MIGIYKIKNKKNGKCYYGSSINIHKRLHRHKSDLKNKSHVNVYLQRVWDKYGEAGLEFVVVEECDKDVLLETEQKYIDSNKDGYNIGKQALGGDNITNHPNRQEIVEKISSSVKDRYDKMSKEKIMEIHSRPMEKNPNWKGGKSYVYCDCGKRIGYKNKTCRDCMPILKGEDNGFYGKKHTPEVLEFLSESQKGVYQGNSNKPIIIDGVEYFSQSDASEKLGIKPNTIRHRVRSKNPKYCEYYYVSEGRNCETEEQWKERFAETKRGKPIKNINKPFTIDGVEYRTLNEASETLGIHRMTIKGRLKSKKSEFDNYKYIDKDGEK